MPGINQLWVTHCSAGKNPIPQGTPTELYRSNRISEFISHCSGRSYAWAILSAKYSLFFPDEKRPNYNVTFKSDVNTKQCMVIKDGVSLSAEQSSAWIKGLVDETKLKMNSKGVRSIVFWPGWSYDGVDPLKRVKCYLKFLHAAVDSCSIDHLSWQEVVDHIGTLWKSGVGRIDLVKDLP